MYKSLFVDESTQDLRLDVFLAEQIQNASRSAIAKDILAGRILINGTRALQKSEKVKAGDSIRYEVEEVAEPSLSPEALQLDVRFEDEFLGVISKPNHLICHPSDKHKQNTLSQILEATYGFEHLGHLQGPDKHGIVHRLDGDTSGLMLFAKDDETQGKLQDQIRLRTLDRRYLALVHGNIGQNTGLIDVSLARSKKPNQYIVASTQPGAREALTSFNVLERFSNPETHHDYTLLECHLYTGRTHQIRVHMAYIGHHVVGDAMYGAYEEQENLGLCRQFLHSWSVDFEHPHSGKHIKVTDELTKDLANVYNTISSFSYAKTEEGQKILKNVKQKVFIDGKEIL